MLFFERTSAVIEKTVQDLRRLSFIAYLIVQLIFLGLYAYKITLSVDHLVYLILYSVIAGLSILGFVYYLLTYKNKKAKAIIATKRGIRLFKYAANAAMIIVLLVEFAERGASDLSIILAGISIASFALQLLLECLRLVYERYAELLEIALNKDVATFVKVSHPLKIVDAPLAALDAKLNGASKEGLSEKERYVEALKSDYVSAKKKSKAEHNEEDKQEIKGHWRAIKSGLKKKFARSKKKQESADITLTKEEPAQK
jgi:hypothetical protein